MAPVLEGLARHRFNADGYKILCKPVLSGPAEVIVLQIQ